MNFNALIPAAIGDYLNAFNRTDYSIAYERYVNGLKDFFRELSACADPKAAAEDVIAYADARVTGLWKKRKLCDMQYFLMLYASPALLDASDAGRELAEAIREGWCARHPDAVYRLGTYAELSSGFNDTILGFKLPGGGSK